MELKNLKWLGHSSFKILSKKIIYIDPWKVRDKASADIILCTHDHYDHLSVGDINKLKKANTIIVVPLGSVDKVSGNVKGVKPGDKLDLEGVKIEVVPAYNTNKRFHPKENNWVGYIITVNGERIYHAGDTDFIPEMSDLKNIGIALLPVSGTYVMTAEEAAEACDVINPRIAIPIHFGDIIGSDQDALRFKQLASCKVEILEKS